MSQKLKETKFDNNMNKSSNMFELVLPDNNITEYLVWCLISFKSVEEAEFISGEHE